jgi:acyl-CoA dehydrogenase
MTAAHPQLQASWSDERIRETVAEVCAVADEEAQEADAAAAFPLRTLGAMRKTGLLGLMVPREQGGAGATLGDLVDVTIALGRSDTSVAMIFAMHCQQLVALDRFANEALRDRVLPSVAAGEVYLASVTTEIGKGGDLLTSESETTASDGCVHIDRNAPVVTGGEHADAFLVTVLAPDATSPSQVDLVFAERSQLELEVLGDWQPLGMRATRSVPMRLVGDVPTDQRLGRPGDFRAIVTSVFGPLAHVGWAAAWLGTATGACSRVVQNLRETRRRERGEGTSELVLTGLASVRARLDGTHALLRHTVDVLERCDDPTATSVALLVNSLKVRAAEECFAAVNELVELVGLRHGYLTNSPLRLERALRDLRSASLNYANARLLLASGSLAFADTEVSLV